MARNAKTAGTAAGKTRKPYPSIDERISMAEKAIERLKKLNVKRQALIDATNATLEKRLATHDKSVKAQVSAEEKLKSMKERKLAKTDPKAYKEAKAEAKASDKALLDAAKATGLTADELIGKLKELGDHHN